MEAIIRHPKGGRMRQRRMRQKGRGGGRGQAMRGACSAGGGPLLAPLSFPLAATVDRFCSLRHCHCHCHRHCHRHRHRCSSPRQPSRDGGQPRGGRPLAAKRVAFLNLQRRPLIFARVERGAAPGLPFHQSPPLSPHPVVETRRWAEVRESERERERVSEGQGVRVRPRQAASPPAASQPRGPVQHGSLVASAAVARRSGGGGQ